MGWYPKVPQQIGYLGIKIKKLYNLGPTFWDQVLVFVIRRANGTSSYIIVALRVSFVPSIARLCKIHTETKSVSAERLLLLFKYTTCFHLC